jgi:hypothetical protein
MPYVIFALCKSALELSRVELFTNAVCCVAPSARAVCWLLQVYLQCALLYTTTDGARRVRISTLALPVSDQMGAVFKGADLDSTLASITRQVRHSSKFKCLAGWRCCMCVGVMVLRMHRRAFIDRVCVPVQLETGLSKRTEASSGS